MQNGDAALRTDMQNGDSALRTEMHDSIGGLRTEMYNQTRMVIMVSVGIWGTVIAGIVAAVVAPILQT